MTKLVRKLLIIHPGEGKQLLLFALLGFLWASALSCASTLGNALFLSHVGADYLPYSFLLIATLSLTAVSLFLKIFDLIPQTKIFLGTLLFGLSIYALFYLGMQNEGYTSQKWFWFLFRVFNEFFLLVMISNYWIFIDDFFGLHTAQRIYGLLNAIIFIGFTFGGIITTIENLHPEELLLFVLSSLFITILTIQLIDKIFFRVTMKEMIPPKEKKYSFLPFCKAILSSPFTLLLMIANLVVQVISVITEYHYMDAFETHFFTTAATPEIGEANLKEFIGGCKTWVSGSNIFFCMFFYSRFVSKLGLHNLLLVTPCCFLFVYLGLSFTDSSLLFPLFGYFIVEGILYSLSDSNFNLLINGVPTNLKSRVRIIIESFFEPIGMLFSGFLLLLTQCIHPLAGLAIALFSLFLALALRHYYPIAITKNALCPSSRSKRKPMEWLALIPPKQRNALKQSLQTQTEL